ncbi:MAG: ribonuclease HII [Pseudomonadota bacterium]|nr:ribonuclease HII [Pseudomonadota bacterium]
MQNKKVPDLHLEKGAWKRGFQNVAGVDEVGRGAWAGPVVAAAVVLPKCLAPRFIDLGINDSKKLSKGQRQRIFIELLPLACIGIGFSSSVEVDTNNIVKSTCYAMKRSLLGLSVRPDYILVDGNVLPITGFSGEFVVKGDTVSLSIAAASIIAKVARDTFMEQLSSVYPGYGWEQNAGYGTSNHKSALNQMGITKYHRKSFKPIIKILSID